MSAPGPDSLGLSDLRERAAGAAPFRVFGRVVHCAGNLVEVEGVSASLGDVCAIEGPRGAPPMAAEVVGFERGRLRLAPLTPLSGVAPGCLVRPGRAHGTAPVGERLLGRVIDGLGEPIDARGPLPPGPSAPLQSACPNPIERPLIETQLDLGVRAINGILPVGRGQRIGIFAGSGVGKSTLLGMMARHTEAPVNVIALIGERGREVNEFLETELGRDGLAHSVVVVATSEQPASLRMRGAFLACAVADYFRDSGRDVLFMMDSVTRFAMAAREVGLAAGEPPTTKGYPPSVYSLLPRLLERAGSFPGASITGIYSVLVEGDDLDDPVADTVRSILDGHIVLDRALAQARHFPAMDVLRSVSRLSERLLPPLERALASRLIRTLAHYRRHEDMIRIGAYQRGSDPETDEAIRLLPRITDYLRQPREEAARIAESYRALAAVFEEV